MASNTRDPFDDRHFDSRAEEAIDWYQHYMSIEIDTLISCYLSQQDAEKNEPSVAMHMAVEARDDEVDDFIAPDGDACDHPEDVLAKDKSVPWTDYEVICTSCGEYL